MLLIEPGIVHDREVGASEPAVKHVAADPAPRGVVIGAAGVHARAGDVEEARECFSQPRSAVVLVGDRVDPQFGDELLQGLGRPGRADFPERLREAIGSAPHGHPDRARIVFVDDLDDQVRAWGIHPLTDRCHAVGRPALPNNGQQIAGRGIAWLVFLEVVPDLAVGLDDLADPPGGGLVLLMHGGRGHQSFHIPLVGVGEKPHHRHGVVGFVLNVGEHEDAHFLGSRQVGAHTDGHGDAQDQRETVSHSACRVSKWSQPRRWSAAAAQDRIGRPRLQAPETGLRHRQPTAGGEQLDQHQSGSEAADVRHVGDASSVARLRNGSNLTE